MSVKNSYWCVLMLVSWCAVKQALQSCVSMNFVWKRQLVYVESLSVRKLRCWYWFPGVAGELQWEGTRRFYREMLYVFEKIILPTYACSHTQFFMFYLVSLRSVSWFLWNTACTISFECWHILAAWTISSTGDLWVDIWFKDGLFVVDELL